MKGALTASDTPQEQLTQEKPRFITYLQGLFNPFPISVFELEQIHVDEVLAMAFESACLDWYLVNEASPLSLQVRDG